MPKDRILSTKTFVVSHLILFLLALALFGGLYYLLYPEKFTNAVTEYLPVTKKPISLFLEVTAPEDDILTSDNSVVISGKTGPDAAVIISSNQTDVGLQADKNGQFSKVFSLAPGPNIIEVSVFDSEGNMKSLVKSVYFSEEKI